jgi:hypothetical protein
MIKKYLFTLACCIPLLCTAQKQPIESLVPSTPSKAPDYFCTWNIQGYATGYNGSEKFRAIMNEESMFGKGEWQNWTGMYKKIQPDLYFVMDDSWDIPTEINRKNNNPYLGRVELDEGRFPSFMSTKGSADRLKKLNEAVKAIGWKGIGGWICAQKSENFPNVSEEEYWTDRIKAAHEAGFDYWKVDWGHNSRNDQWRQMLTEIGKKYAPNLWIEHAMKNEYIEFSDAFRTYDVENIIAIPITIQRIVNLLPYKAKNNAKGIINCEDEAYIAVGLGCAIGVMRHEFAGNLPDGRQDHSFPPVGRNLKKRLDEVVRAVRWHRIAEPFAVDGDFQVSKEELEDTWRYQAEESWVKHKEGELLKNSAPAIVSRRMPLPILANKEEARPYILASRYTNGAVAIAAIGRTLEHEYISSPASVTATLNNWEKPIGLFGYFKDVTLVLSEASKNKIKKIYAQDLAGDTPVDITRKVKIYKDRIIIPGKTITEVGLMSGTEGDISDPGLVMKIITR